jgi:hemolysin activation/secretion protein
MTKYLSRTLYLFIVVVAATLLTACHAKPEVSQLQLRGSQPQETPPTVQVQAYQIDGETFLPPEKLSPTLTRYTGRVAMADISLEARELQEVYRQAGYTNVRVVVPPQRLTNGVIHLKTVAVDRKEQ